MAKILVSIVVIILILIPFVSADAGEQVEYFDNGKIKSIYKYLNINEVYFKIFYENGNIKETGCYTDGKKDRTWISYNSEGQKTAIANYKNGLKNGKWKIFNSDGSLIYEIEYLAGVIIDHSEISSNQKKELPSKETPNFF